MGLSHPRHSVWRGWPPFALVMQQRQPALLEVNRPTTIASGAGVDISRCQPGDGDQPGDGAFGEASEKAEEFQWLQQHGTAQGRALLKIP